MNEAILQILADAFECSAKEAEAMGAACEDPRDTPYHHGQHDAYMDVAKRLRRIVEGGTGIHSPSDV